MYKKKKTEDLRVVKTKNALHNAFFAMLTEMSIEDITINALCDRANVRRATFYKHFSDKIDFITYIIKEIRRTFDVEFIKTNPNLSSTVTYYIKYIESVMNFMKDRENAIAKILNSPMRSAFIEIFMQQNYLDTFNHLKIGVSNGLTVVASLECITSMLVGGISITILRWFENREAESINDTVAEISKLVSAIIK